MKTSDKGGTLGGIDEQLRSLVENMGDMVSRSLPDSTITYISPSCHDLLGYTPEELLNTIGNNLVHPDDRQATWTAIDDAAKRHNKHYRVEHRTRHRDGRYIWVETAGKLLYGREGGLREIQCIVRDISERKWTEQALAASEHLYRTLFESASDGFAILKIVAGKIRYVDCNARQAEVFGCSREEILNRSPLDFSPFSQSDGVPSADKAMEIITAALAGQPQNFIWQHHRKDGTPLDLEVRLNSVDIGGEQLILAMNRDVTERKRTEDALRESRTKLRAIFDHHYQLTGLLDPEGRLLAANKTALELVGADEAEVIGRYFWEGPWWDPSQESGLRSAVERAAKGEFVRFEATHPSADGELRNIDFSLSPIRGDDGDVVYLVPEGRDITERKQAETEREELIANLEAQNTELERFAYTVSHDLRTPLITISNYSGALRQDLQNGNTERAAVDAERIEAAGSSMYRLLNDVLELSRVGRVVNPPEEVPLATLAREVMEPLESRLSAGGVTITIADDLPTLHGDHKRLHEVLQILVENAIKYMGQQPEPRVEIDARQDGDETVCHVRDNGIGIEPKYQERIFDLFDQLDQGIDGSGIGLALAKRIVEIHGGRMWCKSDGMGHGSTFCFTIPAGPISPKSNNGTTHHEIR